MKLTVQEAAKILGVDDEQLYDWIEEESIPAQQLRGQYRINRSELLEWATTHGFTVAPHAFDVPGDPETATSLTQALRAGGIFHRVEGKSVEEVIGAVVAKLPLDDDIDRDMLLQVLVARDRLGLAAIGDGIAIPHVRTPLVLASGGSVAVLAFLVEPLPLQTPDGKPVDIIFFLICPTVHAHLAMLARLAFCLKADAFREAVRRRAAADELLRIAAETEQEQ